MTNEITNPETMPEESAVAVEPTTEPVLDLVPAAADEVPVMYGQPDVLSDAVEEPVVTEEQPEAPIDEPAVEDAPPTELPAWGECQPYGCAPDYDMVPPGALEEAWSSTEQIATTPAVVPEQLAETGAVDYALGITVGLLLAVAGVGVVVLGRMKRR